MIKEISNNLNWNMNPQALGFFISVKEAVNNIINQLTRLENWVSAISDLRFTDQKENLKKIQDLQSQFNSQQSKTDRLENRFNEHVNPDVILPRFKEELLKALEDEEFRKEFKRKLEGYITFTSEWEKIDLRVSRGEYRNPQKRADRICLS